MSGTVPFLITGLAAVIGASYMAYFFARHRRSVALGGLVGAAGAAAGVLLVMLPLNFCTFEPDRKPIDFIFGVLLLLIGIALVLLPVRWLLARRFEGLSLVAAQTHPGAFRGRFTPLLLLAPTLAVLAIFLYYPVFDTFSLSVLLARLGARRSVFVCVDNFTSLVSDPTYHSTLLITLFISFAIVILGLALGLLIATMAYQPLTGARIYRTLLIWPYAISPAVAGVIFLLLFNPAGGLINYFLKNTLGLTVPWLQDPTAARWAVIATSVWKSMGFNILFYIAGLQNVPNDLKESASIDGANALQRFWYVTFPLLSPITFFLIITNMTYAFFETFGTIDNLTSGGPLDATTTMMYRIYEIGFVNQDLGKAAAQSIVLFVMVIGLTVLQFRSTGSRVTYGA